MGSIARLLQLVIVCQILQLPVINSQEITQVPGFYDTRKCVRKCLDGYLADQLWCDSGNCVCSEYLRSSATSVISSCLYTDWKEPCSNTHDLTKGYSVYNAYCGFKAPTPTITTTPGSRASSELFLII
jgi:hypothetical protein